MVNASCILCQIAPEPAITLSFYPGDDDLDGTARAARRHLEIDADIAEYAAMWCIPWDAALNVFSMIGHVSLRRILTRRRP
jgi:hypothetical protein